MDRIQDRRMTYISLNQEFRKEINDTYNYVCPFCRTGFMTTMVLQEICFSCQEEMDKQNMLYE